MPLPVPHGIVTLLELLPSSKKQLSYRHINEMEPLKIGVDVCGHSRTQLKYAPSSAPMKERTNRTYGVGKKRWRLGFKNGLLGTTMGHQLLLNKAGH